METEIGTLPVKLDSSNNIVLESPLIYRWCKIVSQKCCYPSYMYQMIFVVTGFLVVISNFYLCARPLVVMGVLLYATILL